MAYENLNLPDNAIPEGTDISHIEEGVTELNNSLADKATAITLTASSTNIADCMLAIQNVWSDISVGTSTLYLNMAQKGGGLVFKYNENYGGAIVIGYSSAVNPPLLIRNNNNTWTQYSFTVS